MAFNIRYFKFILLLFISILLQSGCASKPEEVPLPDVPNDLRDTGPVLIEPDFPGSSDAEVGSVEVVVQAPSISPVLSEPKYQVSKELFDQTFAEVKKLVSTLNELIRKQEYSKWLTYLSPEYIAQASSPQVLSQQSESAILKSKGIVLANLEDFFKHVVVPSRASVRIDDLVFMNENEVEAIMLFSGSRRVSVYHLIKQHDEWKIGP